MSRRPDLLTRAEAAARRNHACSPARIEALVDAIDRLGAPTTPELAAAIGWPGGTLRTVLREARLLGCVARADDGGRGDMAVWWLT